MRATTLYLPETIQVLVAEIYVIEKNMKICYNSFLFFLSFFLQMGDCT